MRAAIMEAPRVMSVGEWPTPQPGPGEVLVSVAAAGICAGDMYFYLGKNPYAVYPQIAGHEIAGVVAELGEGVSGPAPGTPVVVEPFLGCGHCYPCRVGKSNCCRNLRIIGVHIPGGYGDYVKAPATHVHVVPPGLSLFEASFAEPVAIGVQACRRGEVAAGEEVLILGCGPIGLALIEVARARGAHPIATDVLPDRLETAAQFGAETLPAGDQLLPRILERTGGEGMPVVIEATGNPQAMEQTVDLVAAGGRIVIVGLVKQGVMVSLPGLDFTRKEMTIVGSRASVNCFPEALSLLASGQISYPKVATALSLWDAPAIFADLAEHPGKLHKAVLMREG
ncbi:MAG TPA: zinc-binding alcohol dehydrogenase family protein [Caldilineaceae bacterium]|nr:zinc-binding alcohol dehydrogenase family protein [Caldilineaceae bacterium]